MGKAFVAKLAKQGARDPEALAAWIGRKKHGGKAFGKLSAAGRKKGSSKGAGTAAKPTPSQDVTGKAMSRDERRQVNQMAADMWHEQGLTRADASTPEESEAKSRADVLKRRAIEKARQRGVVRGGIPEHEASLAREEARRGSIGRPASGEVVHPESPAARERRKSEFRNLASSYNDEIRRESEERVKPSTAQEQKDIDRAAAGLATRPDMFRQLDARLPQEGAATTRQQVIQRRAVEKARRLMAQRR